MNHVTVIGAGLAGSECAWQLAQRGVAVTLREMKPEKRTPAHVTDYFAELCCSNSLRGAGLENAVGLLKEELRRLHSLIMRCADATAVPAGGALAVDREGFARKVTEAVLSHPNITMIPGEVTSIPEGDVVIASGPLTSDPLADAIAARLGGSNTLNFFDAAAPLVSFDSVDMNSAYFASRYDKGTPDYINCPMTREEYLAFWQAADHRSGGGGPRLRGQERVRGLYARGGHGAAGRGHPALRPPEAPGARSTPGPGRSPTPWCSSAVTTPMAASTIWWASRPT